MLFQTQLSLTQKLEPSEIQRVESLMTVPFNRLSNQDAAMRAVLGSQRTKEALSSVPWYAKKAAKAELEGKEPEYWLSFWMSGVNSLWPAKASSTAKATEQALPA